MPAKRLLMEECWNKFWREVRPQNAPAIQAREMRRAFYSGGHAILFKVIQQFAPESEPTEADMQIMMDLHQELEDFAAAIKKGEA